MADPNIPIPTYPTTEATSALAFQDLIQEVAYKIGCPSYGDDGNGPVGIPTNAHDLALCQNIVNKAIRMFIHDAPRPNGWKWLNVIGQVDLWPQISYDPTGVTYVNLAIDPVINGVTLTGTTLLTLTTPNTTPVLGDTSFAPAFYQSMEYRQIFLNGNPPANTVGFNAPVDETFTGTNVGVPSTILQYVSSTEVVIDGDPCALIGGTVTKVALTSNVATVTIAPGNAAFVVGQKVTLVNIPSPFTEFNGTFTLTGVTPTTISYAVTHANVSATTTTGVAWPTNVPFSFSSQGDYTMPANFGGQYSGELTYIAQTNRGMILHWTTEGSIRARRQNYNIESGTPYEAAVRIMPNPSYQNLTNTSGFMIPRRRWELMTWRISSEFLSVIFPYTLAFNNLVNLTDLSPAPYAHDETIKAACFAVAEKEVGDAYGPDWQYYRSNCLPNSYRVDAMSAPKALGYFGNPTAASSKQSPIKMFRDVWYQRPTVPVFGQS